MLETTMTRRLQLTFLDEDCQPHRFSPFCCRPDLTEAEVRSIMNEISKLTIFERNGVKQFRFIESAKYIDRYVTVIFDYGDPVEAALEKR